MTTLRACLWSRVSTTDQDTENQETPLQEYAEAQGYRVVRTYTVAASAWSGEHERDLADLVRRAKAAEFDVVVIWSLDRLTRQGPKATLEVVHRLVGAGVRLESLQESWLTVTGELRDLLLSIVGWVARFESRRRSERVKAGNAKRAAQGYTLGRPKGAKDTKRRTRRYARRPLDGAQELG